jgi:hypothetical protein
MSLRKNILFSILALVVVCCLALSVLAAISAGAVVWQSFGRPAGQNTQAAVNTSAPQPTMPVNPNEALPADLVRQMDSIQKQVLSFRSLNLKSPVQRGLLTTSELQKKVETDFFSEYSREDAANDMRVLSAFGLLAPDFKLFDFYMALYAEQVAGYYDPKTKEMFVVKGSGFNGPERSTYAHEFTHVLQDQNFDLRGGLKITQEYCKNNTEYCSAVQALIEGDAVLSEQTWLSRYATAQDRREIQEFYRTYKSPVYDSSPDYLKLDFLFPYQQGFEFVQAQFDRGGWSSINALYQQLPISTEQILHPEKYPSEKILDALVPDLAAALGTGWKEVDRNALGEWYTYLVLSQGWSASARQSESEARKAAAGWGGDQYVFYWNETAQQGLLIFRSRWDSEKDASEFWDASQAYGRSRWGKAEAAQSNKISWSNTPDGFAVMVRGEEDVVWLISPSSSALEAARKALPGFPW